MAGTKIGAAKTVAILRAKDPLFYHKLAVMGGKAGRGKRQNGFAHGKVDPSVAGKLGGRPKGSVGAAKRHRPTKEPFFIKDATIDQHIIEPFNKQPFYRGWFKRSK